MVEAQEKEEDFECLSKYFDRLTDQKEKTVFYVYLSMFFLHDLGRLDLIAYNAQPTGWVTGRMLANQGRASWESLVWEGR